MGDSLDGTVDVVSAVDNLNVAVVDYDAFANYLRKAATILLPEDDEHGVPPALNAALEDRSNQDCIKKFLSDSLVEALYVQRTCNKGECVRRGAWLGRSCSPPPIVHNKNADLCHLADVITALGSGPPATSADGRRNSANVSGPRCKSVLQIAGLEGKLAGNGKLLFVCKTKSKTPVC